MTALVVPLDTYRRVADVLGRMRVILDDLGHGADVQDQLAVLEAQLTELINERQEGIYQKGRKRPWARRLWSDWRSA